MWPHQRRILISTGAPERAFHSVLEHDVTERNVDSYYEVKEMLQRYFPITIAPAHRHHRLHRSIGFVTPQQKWEETEVVYATIFSGNLSN
jgi:hypothetical protein